MRGTDLNGTPDGGWVADHYCRSWQLLKMHNHGPIVNIDSAKPPYGNTRRLITNIDVKNNSARAHTIIVPGNKDAMSQWVYDEVFPLPLHASCG